MLKLGSLGTLTETKLERGVKTDDYEGSKKNFALYSRLTYKKRKSASHFKSSCNFRHLVKKKENVSKRIESE